MRVMVVAGFYLGDKMGGAEYQAFLLARGLAARGHDVFFLGTKNGDKELVSEQGMTIVELPGWRTVGWQAHRADIEWALEQAKPELCYIRIFEEQMAITQLCRPRNISVVTVSCHDMDTTPLLLGYSAKEALGHLRTGQMLPHWRSFWAVRHASAHVCNLYELENRIRRWLPKKEPIKTIYNGSPAPEKIDFPRPTSGQVIWVNNMKRWKRPEVYVELARRLPQYRFVMIGRTYLGRYGRQLTKLFENATPNFHYLGHQYVDEVNEHILQSDLLMYTSLPVEGLGNSFMQAWLRGVPTMTYEFLLDGIQEREGIGRFSATFEELIKNVTELMENHTLRQEMGIRAREYALREHSVDKMVGEYEELFQQIVIESKSPALAS